MLAAHIDLTFVLRKIWRALHTSSSAHDLRKQHDRMAFQRLLSVASVLLAAWSPVAVAQEAESDVKAIPLRTHSLQTVSVLPFLYPCQGTVI